LGVAAENSINFVKPWGSASFEFNTERGICLQMSQSPMSGLIYIHERFGTSFDERTWMVRIGSGRTWVIITVLFG
jgi:hypothetical protein